HHACAPEAPTSIGAVENPVEIARDHREAREDAIRFDLKFAMDPDSGSGEFHREALRRLHESAPETSSIITTTILPFAGSFEGAKRAFTFDDLPWLERVAITEIEGRGENCRTSFNHVSILHKNASGTKKCHDVTTFTCKDPACFSCYRSARRYELERHRTILNRCIAENRLYILEIPCVV